MTKTYQKHNKHVVKTQLRITINMVSLLFHGFCIQSLHTNDLVSKKVLQKIQCVYEQACFIV